MHIDVIEEYAQYNRISKERAHYTKIYQFSSIKFLSIFSDATILILPTHHTSYKYFKLQASIVEIARSISGHTGDTQKMRFCTLLSNANINICIVFQSSLKKVLLLFLYILNIDLIALFLSSHRNETAQNQFFSL
jgi:hypothetical protein